MRPGPAKVPLQKSRILSWTAVQIKTSLPIILLTTRITDMYRGNLLRAITIIFMTARSHRRNDTKESESGGSGLNSDLQVT